ncbi:hypothetical protein ACROYT_G039532 [Oculina patagonica]
MSNSNHANGYQRISRHQRDIGKGLIASNVRPGSGEAILDLGCGTGELSVYIAELVGQDGKVVAVDPDIDRIKVAQESHSTVKNLTFYEGSSTNFPGMGSETYDIIFCNAMLHWVQDKQEAYKNMFSSLRPDGKIVMSYIDHLIPVYDHVYRELNPENPERLLNMFHLETRSKIEEMCKAIGLDIVQSYDVKFNDRQYENCESMCSFFWATTHGVFDTKLVTKDRLARFCARYSNGDSPEDKPVKVFAEEGDFYCVTIAAKGASM